LEEKLSSQSGLYASCCSKGAFKKEKKSPEAESMGMEEKLKAHDNIYASCCSTGNLKKKSTEPKAECPHCKDKSELSEQPKKDGEACMSCCDLTQNYKGADSGKKKKLDKESVMSIVRLSVSLVFLVAGYFNWHHIAEGRWPLMFLYYVNPAWVALIWCGMYEYIAAFNAIRHKKLTAPVLISIAMTACITLEIMGLAGLDINAMGEHSHSYIFAAAEIAFLMSLGELLEGLTVKKCRSGIQRLVSLIPKEANVKMPDGSLVRRSLDNIALGDTVVVKAGEMVAVDGVVTKGEASIDQSSLTGEYLPVDVSAGNSVFGGTMNKNGVVEVEVTKLKKDMTIAKMAELTIEAEGKKAPISRLADKWVGRIVPIVFVTAIAVGLIAAFAFEIGTLNAVIRAITVLVVFCPCALALATPTAVAAGLGNAARNGVLIKSGASLEVLNKVDTVCFDKTGTITEGKIQLSDAVAANGFDKDEMLRLAASVEAFSEHPLAVAVSNAVKTENRYPAENIKTLQGVGISAEINGKEILVSSYDNAKKSGADILAVQQAASDAMSVGKTVAVVLENGKLIGMLAFFDTIRPNAPSVIAEMRAKGRNAVMLTGDNERSAAFIAQKANIADVRHSLMPEDKLAAIEQMQKEGHKVAMIGDGINDAPSLKLADCSFAMGAMGSDIAIDTADMAILNSDLQKVNDTLALSRRVIGGIKRNIIIAMSINLIAVICSMMGWLDPVTGALVHNFTSVLVVASSALLLYNPKKRARKAK
jgi:heavy metal translocating P-type ATPase